MADGIGGGGGQDRIEFILDPEKGVVESIRPIGVVGARCAGLTAPFEKYFAGGKVDTKLPEFYQEEVVRQQAKIGGGYGV
jgi:hypothetical protein